MNSLEQVDWILVFDEQTPLSLIETLHPDILVKGGDYTLETLVGKEYCRNIQIFPFVHSISTTKIIEKANMRKGS
jgi:D-beta-D-heptose 7-phosphate kinase/D-beta-D-heptose 1-phosphate adenosyltransferase